MVNRLVSADENHNVPDNLNIRDVNLPDRLQDGALNATIVDQIEADVTDPAGVIPVAITELAAAPERSATAGKTLEKIKAGTAPNVTLTGHSLIYGQDTSVTGTNNAINGATQKRSSRYPGLALTEMLALVAPASTPTITEHGFPGDRTTEVLSRWANSTSGDVEVIWADTNDARNYGGYPDGTVSSAKSVEQLQEILDRSAARGAQPVVMGGAPLFSLDPTETVYATTESMRQLCERRGVLWLDVHELLASLGTGVVWTDNVHLTPEAYNLIGAKLAALFGPRGLHPVKVAPGKVVYPRHNVHRGGALVARTNATDKHTVRLTAGQTFTLAVDSVAPSEVLVRFYSDTAAASGTGTASMHYALGQSGIGTRSVNFSTTVDRPTPVRGHKLGIGLDVITIRCESGTIEIDSVTFTAPPASLEYGGRNSSKTWKKSNLAGTVLGTPGGLPGGDTLWTAVADPWTPVVSYDGTTNRESKISAHLVLPDGLTGSQFSGLAVHAANNPVAAHGMWSGYLLARNASGGLLIREFDKDAVTTLETVASVFPAGVWRGEITFGLGTDGQASVYVNGAKTGASWTPKWRTFFPGAVSPSAQPITVNACTVFGHPNGI